MGGSGGWFGRATSARSTVGLDELIRQSGQNVSGTQYDAQVNGLFNDMLGDYNTRDVAAIHGHLATIKHALDHDIEGTVDLVYGGSVRKHTYVNGLSDIDMLVRLNGTSLEGETPQHVLRLFARRLERRLPNTQIKVGNLAVTVSYADGHTIQLLPALATKTGLRIANVNGEGWSNVIRPDGFARKLTQVNQACASKVIPVVKLFKAVQETLPKAIRLSGYHCESMAIKAFDAYQRNTTYKDMLIHLCQTAAEAVKQPIVDRTGQSLHVDDYLGPANSELRNRASAYFARLSQRMVTADQTHDLSIWKEIIG